MLPLVQASVAAEAWARRACRCLERADLARGDGDGVWAAWSLLRCGLVEPAAPAPPPGGAWPAVELAVSIPFTAQLSAVSSPAAAARTVILRRQ